MDLDLFACDETDKVMEYEDLVDAKVKVETPEVVTEVDPETIVAVEPVEEPATKRRHGTRQKNYCCDICGVSFTAARDLRVHIRGHDESILPSYECCECKRSFLWPSHLERHMRTHTGDRPYTCYACDRQFAQVGNLNLHVRTHTGERPYTCDACGKRFSRIDNLNTHQRIHSNERPFPCALCPKSFLLPSQHAAHMRHHAGEKPFKCEDCGRQFSQAQGLHKHEYIHLEARPYICYECSLRFAASDELLLHFALSHAGIKTYSCLICDKSFNFWRSARMHLRNHRDLVM